MMMSTFGFKAIAFNTAKTQMNLLVKWERIMIEEDIRDLYILVEKLITLLSDEQLRRLNHNFYVGYSSLKTQIEDELDKRGISKELEFVDGKFKY